MTFKVLKVTRGLEPGTAPPPYGDLVDIVTLHCDKERRILISASSTYDGHIAKLPDRVLEELRTLEGRNISELRESFEPQSFLHGLQLLEEGQKRTIYWDDAPWSLDITYLTFPPRTLASHVTGVVEGFLTSSHFCELLNIAKARCAGNATPGDLEQIVALAQQKLRGKKLL